MMTAPTDDGSPLRQVVSAALCCALLLAGQACDEDPGGGLDAPVALDGGQDVAAHDAGAADQPAAADGTADSATDGALIDAPPAVACAAPPPGAADAALFDWLLICLRSTKAQAQKQTALTLFVKTIESGGGFPIVNGNKVTFFYVRSATYDVEDDKYTAEDFAPDRRKTPLAVAGSFNGWSATQDKMTPEALEVFHATLTINLTAGAHSAYKLVARDAQGKAVWFSDPLSRRFGFDGNGRHSLVRGGKDSAGKAAGHLEWIRAVSATKLGNSRRIYLYLPPGYDQDATKTYPVLYMHDGNNLFDAAMIYSNGTWDVDGTADAEIAAGRVLPFIAVGIHNNAARLDEYTHVADTITVGGKPVTAGGKGKDYLDFVVGDLKPLIDGRYRTKTSRDHTAILGSSLGGLISYHAGLLHPTVFKYVGGMSSTFGWGAFGQKNSTMEDLYKAVSGLKARGQVYYLDSGDNPANPKNPPACPAAGSEDNYCETVSFRDMLVASGIKTFPANPSGFPLTPANIDIFHYHQPDASHSEASWKARLFRPLRLFFRP